MGSKFCSCLYQNPSLPASSSLLPSPPPLSSTLPPSSSALLPLSSLIPPTSSPLLLPSKEKGHITLDNFSIIRSLGKGASGSVLLVKKNSNQKLFAMKIIKKRDIQAQGLESHIQLEKEVLQKNKSRFLVKLKYAFQTPSKIYLVMEYMSGGELTSLLRQYKTFPEPLVVFYSAEILLALEALHSQNVVYRDLKPENILLEAGGHIKLVDFGFSQRIEKKMTNTFAGTPEYMAPEVVLGVGHSKAADLWSLGVVVFEMLSGKPPFWSFDGNFGKIVKGIVENRVDFPVYFSENAVDLVGRLMKSHEQERIGIVFLILVIIFWV